MAAALSFLANQTQVGWLYVITAGIVGLLLIGLIIRRILNLPISCRRCLEVGNEKRTED